MKEDKNIARLICELEYMIGSECYNSHSYDGWNGWYGCEFRYPVYYGSHDKEGSQRTKRSIADSCPDMPFELVETIKYKFGANELFIGLGLTRVLKMLEKRYGIDFSELEERYLSQSSNE